MNTPQQNREIGYRIGIDFMDLPAMEDSEYEKQFERIAKLHCGGDQGLEGQAIHMMRSSLPRLLDFQVPIKP